jgi:hypothetical protein
MNVIKLSPLLRWVRHLPLWLAKVLLTILGLLMFIPLSIILLLVSLLYVIGDWVDALRADGYE